jgi:hypothetical protein
MRAGDGMGVVRSEEAPGREKMCEAVKEVQDEMLRMSHQKCLI